MDESEVTQLAAAMPRALIAQGRAESLARWWVESRSAAQGVPDSPALARIPWSSEIGKQLFEARRAGQLHRGLEDAEKALVAQKRGLDRAPASRAAKTASGGEGRRISRLLVVSHDGSPRFYRQVARLRELHFARLEALVIDCDEMQLGEAAFGAGRVARAGLLDHKDVVIRFLEEILPT